jgi:apolipoprotein N-acyltransferase
LLAGAIFPLGLAPFDVWPLVPLSAGLLCTALNRTQRAGSVGFAYGAGFFGAGVSWVYVSIHVYGNTPVWLALGLTTLFCGGLALLFAAQAIAYRRLASRHAAWQAVQFASLWVLFEWLRSWLLTGFPWLYAGYGALDSPFAGWIPVVGVYGTSWLLVAIGCFVANA